MGEVLQGGHAALAAELGTSDDATMVAVHRLRRQFSHRLREQIADTVGAEGEVDDELRQLANALRR